MRQADGTDEIDPIVVEMISSIRDRFGLHGLRDAQALIAKEITEAEEALGELGSDEPSG
jgi:hypothetical protein